MRWLAMLAAVVAIAGCGPSFTLKDRRFEGRLQDAVRDLPLGDQSQASSRALLADLLGPNVQNVCIIGGGDWRPSVEAQWSGAEGMPVATTRLRDVGSGDLSFDGLVAMVGVDSAGEGHVRRAWFMGECTDYGDPVCLPADGMIVTIVEGTLYDAGPNAGERGRAIQLRAGEQVTCPLEPRLPR